jgi:hypothetical protein
MSITPSLPYQKQTHGAHRDVSLGTGAGHTQTAWVTLPYLEHLNAVGIVGKFDLGPVDTFLVVLGLLELEDKVGKELLQLFVGVVDTQLLERVDLTAHHPHRGNRISGHAPSLLRLLLLLLENARACTWSGSTRTLKSSKPKMSSTPMKLTAFSLGTIDLLMYVTSQSNRRLYSALHTASRLSLGCVCAGSGTKG